MTRARKALAGALVSALALAGCGQGNGAANSATSAFLGLGAPAITTQPSSVAVSAGASASFTVVASGSGLTYQWYKGGTAISGATSATYAIGATTTSDAGTYSVTVANSYGSVTSASVTLTVSTTSSGSNTAAVVNAANAFLATLSASQTTVASTVTDATTVLFPVSRAAAIQWTNLPGSRHGLRLNTATLSAAQLAAAETLMSTALSGAGKSEQDEIRAADDVLATRQSGYGASLYSIAILGTPSTTSAWMLQIVGHHLAYNIMYNSTYVSGSPTFLGVEPPNWVVTSSGAVVVNGNGATAGAQHAPLESQRGAVYNLAQALQANSAYAGAKLSGTYNDVVAGANGSTDSNFGSLAYPTTGRGLLYSSLDSTTQSYVRAVIESYVNTQASDIAGALLGVYESSAALANTYVGYAVGQGGTADFSAFPNAATTPLNAQRSYLRVDGPRVWIEFVVQAGVIYNTNVHYHSIWRDKVADYGGQFGSGSTSF